jgi:hypothetical protein
MMLTIDESQLTTAVDENPKEFIRKQFILLIFFEYYGGVNNLQLTCNYRMILNY